MRHARWVFAAVASVFPLIVAAAELPAFPAPPPGDPVTEVKFGITTVDPYRRLEDVKDPAVLAWMQAQATRTRAILDAIPGHPDVLADVERLSRTATSQIEDAELLRDGRMLVQRKQAGEDISRLLLFDGIGASDGRVLVDPEQWRQRTGKPHAINYFSASPDGRHVLVGISESGSEMASLYVLDLASGEQVGAPISRVWFRPNWLPDGSGFVYNRLIELAEGQPASERQLNSQVHLHRLGGEAEADPVVFGNRQPGSADVAPADMPDVLLSQGGDFMLGWPATVDNQIRLHVAPVAQLDDARIDWRRLIERDDHVRQFQLDGNDLYLMTSTRPGRAIERITLPDGAREVVVEGDAARPIDGFTLRAGALYVLARAPSGVGTQLHRLPKGERTLREVAMPGLDTLFFLSAQEGVADLLVGGTGWTRFPTVIHIDAEGGLHDTSLQPQPAGVDAAQLVSTIVDVPSHDGTLVPLSIVHRRDLTRDGRNPTLLQGYSAYGFSTSPALIADHFAYFDRGFVRAFCHARGGGDKGEAWYRAGFQATKPNTWKDFNACAQYLVDNGYTSPDRLASLGGSAGGILVSNAMVERPDLYRVVFPDVGVLDSLGAALRDPNGPGNWPEFGDPNTEAGYRALHAMGSYQKIADGTAYPAVMLLHGVEDPRVAVWQSSKAAARLQQASSSGRPILLRLDFEAGHGVGSTQSQANQERADLISFMLWQFGTEDAKPAAGGDGSR